ncbi:nucleotidyltransferase domain-containing protein [Sutcliffiella rhizosphaerae]|uniref:Polymerase nucleotidyl transferase domain-containing protein n=1 Tax=Sutcliffiella rhizosphaerae TaxID=2880967 RepID=A0ABN8A8W9_9BACI|nr:nucleotidyltransferase domain-containing protein [Sutcliffiella rhizosphaerae]CAG9621600.1 hypothetical protein BACCIP111883_02373 [Sutcliffiella rhizosphaerae]
MKVHRSDPLEAAARIVKERHPSCNAAILAGSIVRGQETETSDLDIVVFDSKVTESYRESFVQEGWPVELFVHNLISYKTFFEADRMRAKPSLPKMVSEGVILITSDALDQIVYEAKKLVAAGPPAWSEETIQLKRYFLTDLLEDFIGCTNRGEAIFIAGALSEAAAEFELRTNRKWLGSSKWVLRALKEFDELLANEFVVAFDMFYKNEKKEKVILLIDNSLEPYGGRLFEGFSLGK